MEEGTADDGTFRRLQRGRRGRGVRQLRVDGRGHDRQAVRVFVRGGLSSATLHTPKGPATLNLPSPVPTLVQFRALEQAVNANNQRISADLAGYPAGGRGAGPAGHHGDGDDAAAIGLMAKNRFDTHVHPDNDDPPSPAGDGGDSFSAFLPLLLLQPGLLGGLGGSRTASGTQDAMSPLLMALDSRSSSNRRRARRRSRLWKTYWFHC